jgi:predicted ester cyclase
MSDENKKTIRIVREEAVSKRNLDRLDGLYTDDYVYHGPALLGDLRGPTAFKEMVAGFVEPIDGFEEKVEAQIAEGDLVVTRLKGSGRHTGELMGAAPTGEELEWTAIIMSRFQDGKIAEEWAEFDGLHLLQQLGVVPPLG